MTAQTQWSEDTETLPDRRAVGRTSIKRHALLHFRGEDAVHPCNVHNATNAGAGLLITEDLRELPILFALSFDNFRTIRECQLVWRQDNSVGVQFTN